ncbi:MAG: hypothetical protein AB7G75_09175 [Candidatus Binatia bacterium]
MLSPALQRLLLFLLIGGSLVGLVGAAQLHDENRLDRFVPHRPDYELAERRFHDAFGSDLYLPIAVHAPQRIDGANKGRVAEFFQAVASLPSVQRALTPFSVVGDLLDFSLEEQLPLHNADYSTYSALFVLDVRQQQHDQLLSTIDSLIATHLGSGFEVAVGGEPEVNGWLTREGKRLKTRLLPLVGVIGIVMLFLRLPTMRLRGVVIATVACALGNAMLPLVLSGQPMDLLLLLVPLLALVISLAGSIHILMAHRTEVGTLAEATLLRRHKVEATFYCFVTTAIGFGSLATSPIPAIRDLGLLAGAGVFLGGATVIIVLPWLLDNWVPRGGLSPIVKTTAVVSPLWGWIGILTVTAAVFLYPHLRTEMRATHYFGERHPVQQALHRLEQDFLPIRSYDVLIDGEPQALAAADLAGGLSAVPGVQHVLDGELPGFPAFAEQGHVRRATLFVADAALVNPAKLENDIQTSVIAAVGETARVFLVGILARIVSAQQAIYATLQRSLIITGVALTLLFAVITRSVKGTIAAFVANAFPLAGLVIVQYVLDLPLDLGVVLTYSICLGLAVDDTLYLVFDMKKTGGVSPEAIRRAEVRCGPGLYESSWILAAGFALLAFSQFLPVRHFGLLATTGVLLALIGDIVIFPSLISSFCVSSSTEVYQ